MFVRTKHKIDKRHEFALVVVNDDALWVCKYLVFPFCIFSSYKNTVHRYKKVPCYTYIFILGAYGLFIYNCSLEKCMFNQSLQRKSMHAEHITLFYPIILR